jgi:hypothetical protein
MSKRLRLGTIATVIFFLGVVITYRVAVQSSSKKEVSVIPLENRIKASLAREKNVPKEGVTIHFHVLTENAKVVAVGATAEPGISCLFFYDLTNDRISKMVLEYEVENSEIAYVWKMCTQKISEWTGNRLVPWGFSKIENMNAYTFLYCDDYISGWSKWSMGTATIHLDNQQIGWGIFL